MRRNTARAHDLAAPVDIDQKGVQGPCALLDAAFQLAPFRMGKDTREHVEGDQPVRIATLAVNGKGDADAAKQCLSLGLFFQTPVGGHGGHPIRQPRIGRADLTAVIHLVEVAGHRLHLVPDFPQ